jgi:predicted AlkP superfamily phosphohydrolase/phosphomutase
MTNTGAAKKPRVLLIGLDSGDADLIELWMAGGYMPTFAKLRREGLWSRVGTTAEVMHVSAWPTLYTGTTPGQHGLYHAYQVYAGEQLIRRPDPSRAGEPPFWKYLDDAGRRCIILDAFMDYRLPGFKGMQILEYGTWTWFGAPGSTPPGLLNQIKRRFGPYPAPEHTEQVQVPDEPLRFRDLLIAWTQVKSRVTQALLRENDWDLMFVTFGEPHGAGHYLWHFDDPEYPLQPQRAAQRGAHILRDVYSAVDEAIGGILEALDDRTTVIITSGDGMGPNYAGAQLMPEMLHRMGVFHSTNVGGAGSSDTAGSAPKAKKKGALSLIREAIPLGWRQSVSRCMPRSMRSKISLKWMNAGIDWQKSKIFCVPNSNEGYFRVNLVGREPLGIVGRGAEYDDLLAALLKQLEDLTNPKNGVRAAERVCRTDELFRGPRRADLPDALITWNLAARLGNEIATPGLGIIRKPASYDVSPFYTGNHRPNAFVLARGPSVRAGALLESGHILDIAPTILSMLNVAPPPHFEGRAWPGFV